MTSVSIQQLVDAVYADDLTAVQAMIDARPELVHMDVGESDEHQALHHAVLQRRPAIVRFLMQHGADARKGIWPHRSATTAYTLAAERGDDEIVRIIEAEEKRRCGDGAPGTSPDVLTAAGVNVSGGADVDDMSLTREAHAAIAAGNVQWLQARHDDGQLTDGRELLSQAVKARRPDVLQLLLRYGLDPDESGRVGGLDDVVPTWGEPLRTCAQRDDVDMARMLLAHGANPNTNVYASSSAAYEAHRRQHHSLTALLESHGGRLTPVAVAELGLVDHAARMLAGRADNRPAHTLSDAESDVAKDLLWGAIESPSPEIVALALASIDWPQDDPRWHGILENGLYLRPDGDRTRHLTAFRLVLDRCHADVPSRRGTTILHEVAASRGGLTAADRVTYVTLLLDRGARLDVRDVLLRSTPLGWACRWGRLEMVKLLLQAGADPIERDAPRWATPIAWAKKMMHAEVAALVATYTAAAASE